MSQENRNKLKTYFETGDTPNEEEFINLIDSVLVMEDDLLDTRAQLGIGVRDPKAKLQIAGNVAIGVDISNQTIPENGLLVQGDVQIGLSGRNTKLQVYGEIILPSGPPINKVSNDLELEEASENAIPTERAVKNYLDKIRDYIDNLLAGSVTAFGMTTPPLGWLECNGQAVGREEYKRLFEKIETTFGAGDGATTFNVPDLRGEFVRGWSNEKATDEGRQLGSFQNGATARPNNTFHTNTTGYHGHTYHNSIAGALEGWHRPGTFFDTRYGGNAEISGNGNHAHVISGGGDIETRPRNVALMYCIKY